MAFLELTQVNKLFTQGHYAVDNFNLQVERGEFISFLGTEWLRQNYYAPHDRRIRIADVRLH